MRKHEQAVLEHAVRAVGAGLCAGLFVALSGCGTAPPAQSKHLVWPAPPLPARIEFVRSVISDEDVGRDTTMTETLLAFLSGEKPPANRITEPMGLVVSDDGNRLYVSDYAQLAVFVFDFAQKRFAKIGKDEPLGRPMGIALDAEENLYVAEQEKKRVTVFNRKGENVRVITDASLERPGGVAVDRERGRVYVADTGHTKSKTHSVKIFDVQGKLLGELGSGKGSAPGQLLFPTYVSLDRQGNVYITDTLNSRVQVFDPDGKLIKKIGERGNGWGMFDKPKGVATDGFDNVYVVDSGWSNVQIFNQKGEVLLFFGGRGRVPGMLQNPAPIAIDKQNRIYVGDYLNHRVEVYQLVNTSAADSFLVPPGKAGALPTEGRKTEAKK